MSRKFQKSATILSCNVALRAPYGANETQTLQEHKTALTIPLKNYFFYDDLTKVRCKKLSETMIQSHLHS